MASLQLIQQEGEGDSHVACLAMVLGYSYQSMHGVLPWTLLETDSWRQQKVADFLSGSTGGKWNVHDASYRPVLRDLELLPLVHILLLGNGACSAVQYVVCDERRTVYDPMEVRPIPVEVYEKQDWDVLAVISDVDLARAVVAADVDLCASSSEWEQVEEELSLRLREIESCSVGYNVTAYNNALRAVRATADASGDLIEHVVLRLNGSTRAFALIGAALQLVRGRWIKEPSL
jgi:hypothetical protein